MQIEILGKKRQNANFPLLRTQKVKSSSYITVDKAIQAYNTVNTKYGTPRTNTSQGFDTGT